MEEILDSGASTETQNNEATTVEQTQDASAIASHEATISKPEPGTDKTIQQPTKEEILDWQKDERFKRMWINEKKEGDPNRLYKSYRNLEKMHEPLKKQYSVIESTFKELGIPLDPIQIKAIAKEYNELKDPNNPVKQRADYFSVWLDNPLYQQKVTNFYNELEKAEMQRQFPGMNDEQIKKQVELENKVRSFEQYQQKQQQQEKFQSDISTAKEGWTKIKKLADSRGFAFTDEIAENIMSVMNKNQIDTKYLYHTFIELYGEQLDKTLTERTEKSVMERLNKNKQAGVISSTSSAKPAVSTGSGNLRDSIRKAVEKMGIT